MIIGLQTPVSNNKTKVVINSYLTVNPLKNTLKTDVFECQNKNSQISFAQNVEYKSKSISCIDGVEYDIESNFAELADKINNKILTDKQLFNSESEIDLVEEKILNENFTNVLSLSTPPENKISLSSYMKSIADIPLLTPEESKECYDSIKKGKIDKTYELEAQRAKDKLIKAYLKFVVSMSKSPQYAGRGLSVDDLVAYGNLGLIKAVENYEYIPDLGDRFASYAAWNIKSSILSSIIEQSKYIGVSKETQKKINSLNRIIEEEGENVCLDKVSRLTGIKKEKINKLRAIPQSIVSLEMPLGNFQGELLRDYIVDTKYKRPDEMVIDEILFNAEIHKILDSLPLVEKTILTKKYNLDGNGVRTSKEIIDEFDFVGKEMTQIGRIKKRALNLMKNQNGNELSSYLGNFVSVIDENLDFEEVPIDNEVYKRIEEKIKLKLNNPQFEAVDIKPDKFKIEEKLKNIINDLTDFQQKGAVLLFGLDGNQLIPREQLIFEMDSTSKEITQLKQDLIYKLGGKSGNKLREYIDEKLKYTSDLDNCSKDIFFLNKNYIKYNLDNAIPDELVERLRKNEEFLAERLFMLEEKEYRNPIKDNVTNSILRTKNEIEISNKFIARIKETISNVPKILSMYYGLDGEKPMTQKEIVDVLNLEQSVVNQLLASSIQKIKELIKNTKDTVYVTEIFDEINVDFEHKFSEEEKNSLKELLKTDDGKKYLNELEPKQQSVIIHRFGVNGEESKPLDIIGEMFEHLHGKKLTRERIRLIEKSALIKLKQLIKEPIFSVI